MLMHSATRRGEHVVERALQLRDAASAHGHRLDHRHAELCLQSLGIEFQSVTLRQVDHVQRDDRRQPKLDQLQREAKMVVEVRRVDDDQQRVGCALALLAAEQHVARDRFVRAGGIQAVGARKIDHLDRSAVGKRQPARFPLNRDPRIIADLLPRAG